jgi:hypothetical protein
LVRYVDSPYLTPDNNLAENAIRPFVVGRKNWICASRRPNYNGMWLWSCLAMDEGRPLAEGLQDHFANRLMLLSAKADGGERSGKGRKGSVR